MRQLFHHLLFGLQFLFGLVGFNSLFKVKVSLFWTAMPIEQGI